MVLSRVSAAAASSTASRDAEQRSNSTCRATSAPRSRSKQPATSAVSPTLSAATGPAFRIGTQPNAKPSDERGRNEMANRQGNGDQARRAGGDRRQPLHPAPGHL